MILIRFTGESCILQCPNGRQVSLPKNSGISQDFTQIKETKKGKVFVDGKEMK